MTPITKLLFLALMITTTTEAFGKSTDATKVDEFIRQNMPKTVRVCHTDTVANFGLPYPYSVPCITGAFQNMYYWDTFFTNKGLLQIGDVEQAKNNIDNILAMIERFGYMPNATHTALLNRSQPPYASMMVRDLYEATHDKQWLAGAVATLEKEYRFWMTERVAPNGLNRYGHNATRDELIGFCYGIAGRLGIDAGKFADDDAREKAGAHWLAEAESGWDFNPRYDQRCMDFNPVDLNANLYVYETNFHFFYHELGKKPSNNWKRIAKERRKKINSLCIDPSTGLYYDYDYVNQCRSHIYSAGVFNLLYAGIADKRHAKALVEQIGRLKYSCGVVTCEKGERKVTYQWDYPNGWSAPTFMAISGLDRYGYTDEATKIALGYVDSWTKIYNATGNLWEKYNATTGGLDVQDEYAMPGAFMGWTAGVFEFALNYLNSHKQ